MTAVIAQTGLGSQISVAFTKIVTGSSFLFGGDSTLGDATTDAMTGGTSWTVTDVAHALVLPEASVAVQVTGVAPNPKTDPDDGVQLDLTPEQLSLKTGLTLTAAPLEPVHWTVMGAGQVMLGF